MSLRLPISSVFKLSSQSSRAVGVYTSGVFYSIAFYSMLDSALWSAHKNPSDVHIGFVDWLPLSSSSSGMAVINLVEKSRLNGGAAFGSEYGGGINDTWHAKVVLFMGFAFLSGGLAGSLVIYVSRYASHHQKWPVTGMGIENIASALNVMISCIWLWVSQNVDDDYSYSSQL